MRVVNTTTALNYYIVKMFYYSLGCQSHGSSPLKFLTSCTLFVSSLYQFMMLHYIISLVLNYRT